MMPKYSRYDVTAIGSHTNDRGWVPTPGEVGAGTKVRLDKSGAEETIAAGLDFLRP
jgi:hypothetical protein